MCFAISCPLPSSKKQENRCRHERRGRRYRQPVETFALNRVICTLNRASLSAPHTTYRKAASQPYLPNGLSAHVNISMPRREPEGHQGRQESRTRRRTCSSSAGKPGDPSVEPVEHAGYEYRYRGVLVVAVKGGDYRVKPAERGSPML